jgi:hypothetical protein
VERQCMDTYADDLAKLVEALDLKDAIRCYTVHGRAGTGRIRF